MFATLGYLVNEGLLSKEKAEEIGDTHIVALTSDNNLWDRIKNFIRYHDKTGEKIVILKLCK